MAEQHLYQVTLSNLPFKQAQALYRFLINLEDEESLHGAVGMSWSGAIPGQRYGGQPSRAVTIDPMPKGVE